MPKPRRKPQATNRRRGPPAFEAASPVDFRPILPFLTERVGEGHPIHKAALAGDLSAFMAAIRESGDTTLEHEIAGELERIPNPLEKV